MDWSGLFLKVYIPPQLRKMFRVTVSRLLENVCVNLLTPLAGLSLLREWGGVPSPPENLLMPRTTYSLPLFGRPSIGMI